MSDVKYANGWCFFIMHIVWRRDIFHIVWRRWGVQFAVCVLNQHAVVSPKKVKFRCLKRILQTERPIFSIQCGKYLFSIQYAFVSIHCNLHAPFSIQTLIYKPIHRKLKMQSLLTEVKSATRGHCRVCDIRVLLGAIVGYVI